MEKCWNCDEEPSAFVFSLSRENDATVIDENHLCKDCAEEYIRDVFGAGTLLQINTGKL